MLTWLAAKTATIIVTLASSYAIGPACGYIAAHVGTYVGSQAIKRVYSAGSARIRGVFTVTLSRSRTYIVSNGNVLDVDPRKKYQIIRGEIKVLEDEPEVRDDMRSNIDPPHKIHSTGKITNPPADNMGAEYAVTYTDGSSGYAAVVKKYVNCVGTKNVTSDTDWVYL